jgi:three-Cys-motif partner protein
MPRSDLDRHFEEERPEWTKRKHAILGRYVVAGAMKISFKDDQKRVALVDGFAGPNEYGGQIKGSTVIMLEAAHKAVLSGRNVSVHACEVDPDRFATLTRNLKTHIDSGLLRVYNKTHAEALAEIIRAIGSAPAMVFLDPQTAAQMTLSRDLKPWAQRSWTDILGVFMASQACRICASAANSKGESAVAEAFLGPKWREAATEAKAIDLFLEHIRPMKKYVGLYMLRKVETETNAYGFFGLSDSPHGYWLLSDAVAKDAAKLKAADEAKKEAGLFDAMEDEENSEALIQRLADLARPFVAKDSSLIGDDLAIRMFGAGVGVQELFGRYQHADFTTAARRITGMPTRRKGNAKAE